MKPSDFQKTIQCQFECKLKQVVKGIIWNYRKELRRRKNKEISFSELPDITVESLATWDDYETNYTIFNVCGIDIKVLDDELAEALKQLPEKKRNNVLMYYFLEMSDTEIADIMNYTRGAVFKHRHRALETMKEILKEKK
ncbi:sigma-70 family RNA polymerase sigma factor [Clostridioides difficile]|uniref:RNA polymerase sigma factor n=1 Tax=Blautia marasmi TaxID=1917868 RepID=UPI001DB553CF|nr:sigma-70 family RNA polymerase sigma factor [Clostridioides difficile]MBY1723951.1 sigma-70 family RNA polymerase sigma factor [Clostridioides difficile]MCA0743714.1 sigma-70 family RNA polymerase sigma factor [Clostridioides difficile]MDM9726645.1 sigma factor-like helix-turn-helix DNA-binding protein [Clostridioides difficile]MDM9767121.1 sigma factor-like helix-turn-helix DNA-binding protein [Clostridioides difficile]